MRRNFSPRFRNRRPYFRPRQSPSHNFNSHHHAQGQNPSWTLKPNNHQQYQYPQKILDTAQIIWDPLLPPTRMESDVEEGEIRESELLSPLSEDEEPRHVTPPPPSGHRRRKRPTNQRDYLLEDESPTKGRTAYNLATDGGWVSSSGSPPRYDASPAPRRRRGRPKRTTLVENLSVARWASELDSKSRDTVHSPSPPHRNVHRKRFNEQDRHAGRLSLEGSSIPSPTWSSPLMDDADVDQHQGISSRHDHRTVSGRTRHKRSRTMDDGERMRNGDVDHSSVIRRIPGSVQQNRVIVFCDPPRSPDAVHVDHESPPTPVVQLEEMETPQPNNEGELADEEDNDIEVLSIIDRSTRVAELIVIDSTSSSESEMETDFEDPDADPTRGALPPPRPQFVLPPAEASPVSSANISTDSHSPAPLAENNSPPAPLNDENWENDSREELSNINTTENYNPSQTNSPAINPEDVDDEDLEVLELRIQALTGLMQTMPSSQSDDKVLGHEETQTETTSLANIPPDDSEKENENELELLCLRSKLLSDLATQKKKKEAMDLLKRKQATETEVKKSSSTSAPPSTSKRQTERRNSKSSNSNSAALSSSSRGRSGRRTSSDISFHTHSNSHTSGRVSSSSGSQSHTHRHSSNSSAKRTSTRPSSSKSANQSSSSSKVSTRLSSSSKSATRSSSSPKVSTRLSSSSKSKHASTTKSSDLSTISISVSQDGRHRTVTSRESATTSAQPSDTDISSLTGIVVQTDENEQRVVRILDSIEKVPSPIPPATTPIPPASQSEPQPESSIGVTAEPRPKKAKISSPQKTNKQSPAIPASGTSGPQKVITKPVNRTRPLPPSLKMTPYSHQAVTSSSTKPTNEFSITRTIVNPNAFKSKYGSNPRKNVHSIDRTTRGRGGSRRKIQPIVIELRNNDESTEDEDDEDSNSTASANLPQEFHSSLDKFLKSVRESASKNGISGNPYLQSNSLPPTPNLENNILNPPSATVSPSLVSPEGSGSSGDPPVTEEVQQNEQVCMENSADNQSSSSCTPTTTSVADETQPSSPLSINSPKVLDDEVSIPPQSDGDGNTIASVSTNDDKLTPTTSACPSPSVKVVPSPLSSPPVPSVPSAFTAPEISTLNEVDQVLERSLEQSAVKPQPALKRASSTPPTIRNNAKSNATGESLTEQFNRTKEELQLREKLLRATFKKSEIKINLTRSEKDFLTSRKSATNLLVSAIDKINQHVEKKSQCSRIEQQVDKLRKQLEVAEKSLYFKNLEADAVHEDAVSTIAKAFDMRSKSVNFGIECKKLGAELTGELYKIPSTGAGDMLTKFKEIFKLTTKDELKKGPINFKKLEEQIISSLKGPNHKRKEAIPTPSATSSSTIARSNQASAKNTGKRNSGKGLGSIIVGGLTRHVLEPDRKVRPLKNRGANGRTLYLPNFLLKPKSNKSFQCKFIPYTSVLFVTAADGNILSTIDCNAVVCPNIVLNNCNSHNCKFQHLPDSRNARNEKDGRSDYEGWVESCCRKCSISIT